MKKILALTLSFVLFGFCFIQETPTVQSESKTRPVPMPLVKDPLFASYSYPAPIEQRGVQYRKWLSASVKISVSNASGSGTIVYYDKTKNLAYVASCGHLWDGNMSASEGRKRNLTCTIITWYKNEKKLMKTQSYRANVIFYSNRRGYDSSLITFQPDWNPNYFPIAPLDHSIPNGSRRHSCGCDSGREVAHYDVEIINKQGMDLITRYNSPRPGRSGGGLMDEKWYIGTCWGTSERNGTGIGYFTPLSSIHKVYSDNGYNWLLELKPDSFLARRIPIYDWNNPQGKYPIDYISIPK